MTDVGEIVNKLPEGAVVLPPVGGVTSTPPPGAVIRKAEPAPPIPEPMASFMKGIGFGPEALSDVPTSLEEAAPGSRATTIGTAALIGGEIGAVAGPPGVLIGGALGTAAGVLGFRNLEDFASQAGLIARPESPTLGERASEAAQEVAIDLAFAGASEFFRPILGARALAAKLFKLNDPGEVAVLRATEKVPGLGAISRALRKPLEFGGPEAGELIAKGQDLGIPVGAADVGGDLPRTIIQTTSVFPITGTPARKALAGKEAAVVERVGRIIDDLSPSATLHSAGVDLTESAVKRFGKFKKIAARLYSNFETLAKGAGEVIPTESAREQAQSLAGALDDERILIDVGEELKEVAPDLEKEVRQYLADFIELPESITIEQYRGLVRKTQNIMNRAKIAGLDFSEAAQMKGALEVDLNNIQADDAIKNALDTANNFYSTTARRFETATGKRFGRFDRNVFGPGPFKAGALNADEIASIAVNLKSPQAIADLEAVVGKNSLREAGGAHFRNALEQSISPVRIGGADVDVLDPDKFIAVLGISGKRSTKSGIDELLQRTGFDPQDLKDVLELAAKFEQTSEPGKFLKRRVILGGAGAATALAGFGGALAGAGGATGAGLGTAAVATFLARHMSKIVADPEKLKLLRTALDTANDQAAIRAAWARLGNALRIEVEERRNSTRSRRATR